MGNKKGLLKSILPWLIVLMVISVAIPFFNQSESSEIRYDKFIEIVQKEKYIWAKIQKNILTGRVVLW